MQILDHLAYLYANIRPFSITLTPNSTDTATTYTVISNQFGPTRISGIKVIPTSTLVVNTTIIGTKLGTSNVLVQGNTIQIRTINVNFSNTCIMVYFG